MVLEQFKLRNNKQAVLRYKNRLVKIFCPVKQIWLCCSDKRHYTTKKQEACVFTVSAALLLCQDFIEEQKIELHFEDSFGDQKMGIKDYDDEHIYDCPSVRFDRTRINQVV